MPKKRHRESPFKPELMAAISKELPGILAKEGYFKKAPVETVKAPVITAPEIRPIKRNQPAVVAEFIPPISKGIPDPVPRGNLRALWYGVGAIGLLILGIWAFNLRTIVSTVWAERDGADLVDRGKDDLKSILETIKQNDKIAQDRLREASIKIPIAIPTSTTSTEFNTALENLAEAIKAKQNQ